MKKSRACFADGGQISKADQLIAEMNAKYGVSGNSPATAPVAQQPATQPAPQQKPQSKGLVGDAMNLFSNRQKQIDKASGYANGGLIEGIGTPTSDSIPAKVKETGEDIAVSTKERIVSHEQDKLLQRLAKAMGFESVDAFFEAGTGKPVGPTIKGGKKAAAGGWSLDNDPDAYAKTMQDTRNAMSIPSLNTNNSAAQGGIYKDVGFPSISMGAGQAPTIYDNGGLPTKTDRVSGSLPVATVSKPAGDGARPWYMQDPLTAISSGIEKSMNYSLGAGQAPTIYDNGGLPTKTDRVSGSLPVANSQKPVSQSNDGPRPWYAGASTADNRTGLEMERGRRAEATSAGVMNDPVKSALQYGVVGQNGTAQAPAQSPVHASNQLSAGVLSSSPFSPEKERFPLPAGDGNFITGKDGAMPDSSGGGFTQGGKSYNVNQVGQDGNKAINRVTAPGTSPLYTNIKPEDAVSGLKNQMIGSDAEGLARYARSVAINKERIDAQPMGGVAVLPDQAAEANAQLDAMRQSSLVSGLSPSQQAAFQQAQAQLAMQGRGQQLAADNARYAADVQAQRAAGHDQVIARGQDLHAQNEQARIAGNPIDNQAKQISLAQAQRISELQGKVIAGDKTALASLQALTGKNPNADRYITVQGGEEIGPDGMSKIRRPSYVFDQQTGRRVQEDGQQSSAPSVGEVRGGYRFKGGNPADKAAWEKA